MMTNPNVRPATSTAGTLKGTLKFERGTAAFCARWPSLLKQLRVRDTGGHSELALAFMALGQIPVPPEHENLAWYIGQLTVRRTGAT